MDIKYGVKASGRSNRKEEKGTTVIGIRHFNLH
jgi:hypothetical protein